MMEFIPEDDDGDEPSFRQGEIIATNAYADLIRGVARTRADLKALRPTGDQTELDITLRQDISGKLLDKIEELAEQHFDTHQNSGFKELAEMDSDAGRRYYLEQLGQTILLVAARGESSLFSAVVSEHLDEDEPTAPALQFAKLQQSAQSGMRASSLMVTQLFNNLAEGRLISDDPAADKACTAALDEVLGTVNKAAGKHLNFPAPVKAPDFLVKALMTVMLGHLGDAIDLARSSSEEFGPAKRLSGAILAELGIPQEPPSPSFSLPPGSTQLVPESIAARQVIELTRVFVALTQSLVGDDLQTRAKEQFAEEYKAHFGRKPRPVTDAAYEKAYNKIGPFAGELAEQLFALCERYDGWLSGPEPVNKSRGLPHLPPVTLQ
jgi:hypothetical protein